MIKLIKNEIIKQVNKLSFAIMMIILIASAFLIPFLVKYMGTVDYEYTGSERLVDAKRLLNIRKDEFNSNYYKIKIKYYEIEELNKITYEDFRYELIDNVIDSELKLYIINSLINNEYENIKEDASSYLDFSKYENMSIEDLKNEKKTLENIIKDMNDSINKNDFSKFLNFKIDNYEEEKEDIEKRYENLNNDLELSLEKERNKSLKVLELHLEIYKILKEKKIEDSNDFRVKNANAYFEALSESVEILSEKEFNNFIDINNQINYKKYLKINNRLKENYEKKANIYKQGIIKDINVVRTDTKVLISSIGLFVSFIGLFSIIISGTIVSSEFSSGTIRLLLTKPDKRWKILLSKLLASLFLSLIMVLTFTTVYILSAGFMFGFNSILGNDLIYVGDNLIKINYILSVYKDALIYSMPVFFITIFAFALSTIINSSSFSVGVGIFTMLSHQLIINAFLFLKLKDFVKYTFFPHLDFSKFLDFQSLAEASTKLNFDITISLSIFILIIHSIILYFISNIVFIRKDIKN